MQWSKPGPTPLGARELEQPLRDCPPLGQDGLAFPLPMGQSSDVGCPGKGVTSGEVALCHCADRGGPLLAAPQHLGHRPWREGRAGGTSQCPPWPPL